MINSYRYRWNIYTYGFLDFLIEILGNPEPYYN
jgi:hypothetical protein